MSKLGVKEYKFSSLCRSHIYTYKISIVNSSSMELHLPTCRSALKIDMASSYNIYKFNSFFLPTFNPLLAPKLTRYSLHQSHDLLTKPSPKPNTIYLSPTLNNAHPPLPHPHPPFPHHPQNQRQIPMQFLLRRPRSRLPLPRLILCLDPPLHLHKMHALR